MGILFDFMPSTGQRARQRDSGRRFDDGAASYEMDCRSDIRMHVSKGTTAVVMGMRLARRNRSGNGRVSFGTQRLAQRNINQFRAVQNPTRAPATTLKSIT